MTRPTPDMHLPHEIEALIGRITTGRLDGHLATISHAIAQRHQTLTRRRSTQARAALQIGDRVRVNHDARPLYLHGATGTITDWAHKNVVVQLDQPIGRFTSGQLRCPPLILERLTPE